MSDLLRNTIESAETAIDKLKERIWELEADNVSLQGGWLRAEDRIKKAREILKEELKHASGGYFPGFIQGVIDALEGK